MSKNGKYLAAGNYSGIVNIYDLKHNDQLEGKPVKSIQNLTTAVNLVEFNHNDEILAIGSKWKKNGLRLVHMDSLTVFENFPSFKNNVKYAFSCSFSPTSEFFTVGNDEGHDYLFNLKHY
jgi:U3 small nucleolar RNA-associated protein 18